MIVKFTHFQKKLDENFKLVKVVVGCQKLKWIFVIRSVRSIHGAFFRLQNTLISMRQSFNIYCDESCHLEKDKHGVMVIGAVWCPRDRVREISMRLREIKRKNGLKPDFEIKWSKISETKLSFYLEVLDLFFDRKDLHFRAVVIPDKSKLNHSSRNQTHDEWYYKMYFTMLKQILYPMSSVDIYIDIKDTRSAIKERRLLDVLRSSVGDYEGQVVTKLQSVRSHQVELIQLADLLIGAIGYVNRALDTSKSKLRFVSRFRERSKRKLTVTTLPLESKVNLLIWKAQGERDV